MKKLGLAIVLVVSCSHVAWGMDKILSKPEIMYGNGCIKTTIQQHAKNEKQMQLKKEEQARINQRKEEDFKQMKLNRSLLLEKTFGVINLIEQFQLEADGLKLTQGNISKLNFFYKDLICKRLPTLQNAVCPDCKAEAEKILDNIEEYKNYRQSIPAVKDSQEITSLEKICKNILSKK